MPIVDGLTSTKMIRSYEKTHSSDGMLSPRAARNGRIPIIAVSASLVEKDVNMYMDAGFDGWILKPISFPRLSEIMEGMVNEQVRHGNLYQPGSWERGGWLNEAASQDMNSADTRPSEMPPSLAVPLGETPSEGVKRAAATDDAMVKEEAESEQTKEQVRLEST